LNWPQVRCSSTVGARHDDGHREQKWGSCVSTSGSEGGLIVITAVGLPNCRVAMTDHPGSPDRPEELELVDQYVGAAELAHLYAFGVHRELVELDADGDRIGRLLAESAAIALQEIPALVRDWRLLEREWFEVELLDPTNLDRKTNCRRFAVARTRSSPNWPTCSTGPSDARRLRPPLGALRLPARSSRRPPAKHRDWL
jgi:hypothetical protein